MICDIDNFKFLTAHSLQSFPGQPMDCLFNSFPISDSQLCVEPSGTNQICLLIKVMGGIITLEGMSCTNCFFFSFVYRI